MRKVDRQYLDPIENIITDVGDYVIPYYKASGHTPNVLTTYSFFLGLTAVYYLYYHDNFFVFAVCIAMSFAFDCWDGHMARSYNMTSRFGDLYDHITDVTVHLILIYVVYKKYKGQITPQILILVGVMIYLMNKQIGCYQRIYKETQKGQAETIDVVVGLCPNKNDIKWTRLFGPGVFNVMFIVGIIYWLRVKSNEFRQP